MVWEMLADDVEGVCDYKSDSSFPKNCPCQNLVVLLKCRQEKIKCGEKIIRRHMKREVMQNTLQSINIPGVG
jgi:hypothetical protein